MYFFYMKSICSSLFFILLFLSFLSHNISKYMIIQSDKKNKKKNLQSDEMKE